MYCGLLSRLSIVPLVCELHYTLSWFVKKCVKMEGVKSVEELKQRIRDTAKLQRFCGIKWLKDQTIRMISLPPIEFGYTPCPLAPGCIGDFLRASSMKMESAIILGFGYTKAEARERTMKYLKKEGDMLMGFAKKDTNEDVEEVSDVEGYVNGEVTHRQVNLNTQPWDETLPDL